MNKLAEIIVDIRCEDAFLQGHQQGCVHFDGVSALSERQYELPEPQQAMTLVHAPEQLAELETWLVLKGYQQVKRQVWSNEFKQQLMQSNALATGSSLGYVWRPSPVVQAFIDSVSLPDESRLQRGLDIGCGAGRDMVALAMQGWRMTGVDIRSEMLEKAQALAQRQQVKINTWQRDCEADAHAFADCASESFGLINVARYLHRPLFTTLKSLLAPKGYVVYHTFMQGCEAFGSPKNPRFLLAPNELATVFADYHILRDEVITLADGRPMSAFVAQKP